ncbi:hypothetical protein ABZX98_07765 [Streptomyces sp. NPDC002992]|uniref:hypothetical protein n=1 Tax=Streptomyces sp. NPDC002992 TaxID=3154273 RepID=UPI0033B71181
MEMSRPAIVCRLCRGRKTDLVAVEERQALRCRQCRRTWWPYDTSPSPAPDYRTAYETAPPECEEDEALAALQAGLDAATAAAKAVGKRRLDPRARRLLLLRRAALADRRAYATELEHLRDAATVAQVEYALDHAEVAAEALRAFDTETDGVYASGVIRAEHPIWDNEPDLGRAYVRQEYEQWTRAGAPSSRKPDAQPQPRRLTTDLARQRRGRG